MENEKYFQANLETGKLNIFSPKSYYDSLDFEQKKTFKKYCLWSRNQNCWVSKGKAENTYCLQERLKSLGFVEAGPTGIKPSFEEKVNREMERAAGKAERAEKHADNAEKRFDELYGRASDMQSVIPLGQPILVGHHSEKRDRNYRDRIHNTYGKAFKEADKAKYFEGKAQDYAYDAEGKKYQNVRYLSNRIKDCQRDLNREESIINTGAYRGRTYNLSQERKDAMQVRINENREKLDFYTRKMKEVNPEWKDPSLRAKRNSKKM